MRRSRRHRGQRRYPKDGDERFVATDSDLEPSSCGWTECTNDCRSEDTATKQWYERHLDSSGNCTDCYIDDTTCSCNDCASYGTDGLCPQSA